MTKHQPSSSKVSSKKTSIVSVSEDEYSLTFKITKESWESIKKRQQREIKAALRDLDDSIYALLESHDEGEGQDGKADN